MFGRIRMKSASILFFAILLWSPASWANQGQWGGFFYLFPKSGAEFPAGARSSAAKQLGSIGENFGNDFNPEKGRVESIQDYTAVSYSLDRKPITMSPAALIRVESMRRDNVENYLTQLREILGVFFTIESRFAVTRQLNYTDAETLKQLKDNAPKRGKGTEQPNAVVFPLSKIPEWWALTQEKRQQYFFKDPERFGKEQMGHNEIGFLYIRQIFRKLYHSRFDDPGGDFITYFEFSDDNLEAFNSLLEGLRNVEKNPEWKFVAEGPLFSGKRVSTPADMLGAGH